MTTTPTTPAPAGYVTRVRNEAGETLLAQRQDSLQDQLEDLIVVATRNGMYDAADWIRMMMNLGER